MYYTGPEYRFGADYRTNRHPTILHPSYNNNRNKIKINLEKDRLYFSRVLSSPPFTMSSITHSRAFYPSDRFVISCGTIPLDLINRRLLMVRLRSTNEIFLPKGRKDENECLKTAAARETHEETGYHATILPLNVPTRATNRSGDGEHTEPIAITQRITDGVLKIIFWYVASVDSQALPVQGTQQEGEDFESVWMDCGQALAALTFADDREITQMAIHAVFGVGSSTAPPPSNHSP